VIKFIGEYKSLNSFDSDNLNPFTVITGKNGSGKSQLIELIGLFVNQQLGNSALSFTPEVHDIQIEGVENGNLSQLNNANWKTQVDQHASAFNQLRRYARVLGELMVKNSTWIYPSNTSSLIKSITSVPEDEIMELVRNVVKEVEGDSHHVSEYKIYERAESRLRASNYFDNSKHVLFKIAQFVSEYQHKGVKDLEEADFYLTPIPDDLLNSPRLFGSQLEYILYNYAKRRDLNRRLYFDKVEDKKLNAAVSDEEFVKLHSPPWIVLNKILELNQIDFQIRGVEKEAFSPDIYVPFQLEKISSSKVVRFVNLSSGEKVILGLVIKLFTSSYYNESLKFPELIVLDEPDAHLHPEMSKLLIDVLNETFVQQLGIKVIMTTHSPSTIALCPEDSIYQMSNHPSTSLKKIEKNDALKLLIDFIPTLSIDYENHKQVFVESPTDVRYYQTIFDKLNQERKYPFKLYFISNSGGMGNCDQVTRIVNSMRQSGNTTSFGIIDWDRKNESSSFVKVHGESRRYSIENYLYDPVYLVILLMELEAHNVHSELGFDNTANQYSLGQSSEKQLQDVADWFFKKFCQASQKPQHQIVNLVSISYVNGKSINVPSWFVESRGHDFEPTLKVAFEALSKYRNEGSLSDKLITIMGKCYPLIPKDSEELIERIINQQLLT